MAAGKSTALLRHINRLVSEQHSQAVGDRELLRRFTKQGDAAAFSILLERHGPMVLRVCRRLLPGAADAEDAFQATFLVLLRRASALRWRRSVAGWLHEVAFRVARHMRNERFQRRIHEARVPAQAVA